MVILDPAKPIAGLNDSKKISEKKRLLLAQQIKTSALAWAIARAEASEIDRINILQASLIAMQRAFTHVAHLSDYVMVDGNRLPNLNCPSEAIIHGDQLIAEISAASILAKVARDEEMQILDRFYPGYDFCIHKGYPTTLHIAKLKKLGITPQHRISFAPVKKLLA